MSKDNQKPGGSGIQTETEKLKRKIQMLEEKNSQLEQLAIEQEQPEHKKLRFEDHRLENETLLKSGTIHIRRNHDFRIFGPTYPQCNHFFSTKDKQNLAFSDPPHPLQVIT